MAFEEFIPLKSNKYPSFFLPKERLAGLSK